MQEHLQPQVTLEEHIQVSELLAKDFLNNKKNDKSLLQMDKKDEEEAWIPDCSPGRDLNNKVY